MDDFLQISALLRARHQRPPGFNLFSVLRSSSDEVRLHSRFLAFLLDPKASHNQGTALLNLLLKRVGVQNFDSTSANVEVEYKNIDILVRNQSNQAVIIENKVYARDRDEQLWDYHQQMLGEGYRDIWTTYLTLDGTEPSEQSKKSLPVILISYEAEIISWLKDCIPLVAREPGVRESIFQYIELLQKLTSSDQSEIYMSKLKEQILLGENIFVIADINHAFQSVLADLQLDIWERMTAYQERQYPHLGSPVVSATEEAVSDFYKKAKNNKYIGLTFPFSFMQGGVYIEVNHRLYVGYCCDGGPYPEDRERLFDLCREIAPRSRNTSTLYWRYSKINVNFHAPSNEDLALLRDPEMRESIAISLIDDANELWQRAHQKFA
ncbi:MULTISPECIES: PDDEXK-like family protein [unclassified Pseudomonas]|uniref:PDDEXK-like family protein n=1 Tax=unclassified Pseudomonas TaxID=196821 RepID=UPI001462B965|nr:MULTISPECIES: PD-(D/E)XK nuclease family protein [unclassified Pseudomonas]QJI19792.1 PD-(D/E)XK nuclease family protein [Pseudomonas sp. ADAK21]QJI25051.1 PD-(D/E)XK nuclease family protein [Pseudomonas sp. ADAK20]